MRIPRHLLGSYLRAITDSQELIADAQEVVDAFLDGKQLCAECGMRGTEGQQDAGNE